MSKKHIAGKKFMPSAAVTGRWLLPVCLMVAGMAQAQVPTNTSDYSRTSSFTYRADGLLQSETVEPGLPQSCVVTTHEYDTQGNRIKSTTANCGGATGNALFAARWSSSKFEAQNVTVGGASVNIPAGAFATTATNMLNHVQARQYDPRFGAVIAVTEMVADVAQLPSALTTKVEYDDLGRKVRTTAPDGTSVVSYYCYLDAAVPDTSSNSVGCPKPGNVAVPAKPISPVPGSSEVPADAIAFTHSEPRSASDAKIGPFSRTYIDRLGRKLREVTEAFDGPSQPTAPGSMIVRDTRYSDQGVVVLATQPYFLANRSSTSSGSVDVGLTATAYDLLGRPTQVYTTDPMGSQAAVNFPDWGSRRAALSSISYNGLTTTTTNDKGQTQQQEKNVNGQVVRITDALGAQVAHQYDAFDNLIKTRDALQNVISVGYDIRGRKVSMDDPDKGRWTYDYDALGQLVWQQNATQRAASPAQATTMAYDVLGRMIQRTEPEYISTWSYDKYADGSACNKGIGKLCESATSTDVKRKLVYDNLGRLINTRTDVTGGPTLTAAVSYDAVTGRASSQTYPSGLKVDYNYTTKGFFKSLTLATAATVNPLPATPGGTPGASANLAAGSVLWEAQVINAWGQAEQQRYGNGVIGKAVYDAVTARVSNATAGVGSATDLLNHSYGWDSLNRLGSRIDHNGDGSGTEVSETFDYDALNRLKEYIVAGPQGPGMSRKVTLQYNALGSVLYKSDVGVYSYGAQGATSVRPHALASVAGASTTTYGYDANGNLISASAGKYRGISYTSFNLPNAESGVSGPTGGPQYRWAYDESHQRLKETRVIASGAMAGTRTTYFLHPDNAGGLSFEREVNSPTSPSAANPAVASNRHYLSAGGVAIGVLVSTGNLPTIAAGQTAPAALSSITLVKVEYWHRDHLGSLAGTSDHTGAKTARYAYDPFGKRRELTGSYDAAGNLLGDWSAAVNSGTDRGYTGHEHLDDVGLVHMNGRIFDPTLGVFLQGDPLIQAPDNLQNYNRYGYCYNNPLTCTDPSGLSFWDDVISPMRLVFREVGFRDGQTIVAISCGFARGYWGVVCQAGGTYDNMRMHGYSDKMSQKAAFRSGLIALASIAANKWIGDKFPTRGVGSSAWTRAGNTAAHGIWGCAEARMNGGSCGGGFRAGIAGSAWSNHGPGEYESGNRAWDHTVNLMTHAFIGGVASRAGGGSFAEGARTAAYAYLFNQLVHEGRETWADRYRSAIQQYEKTNPLEVALFTDMLGTIPDYVVGNENTWASVVAGFASYARENAVLYVGAAVADFENSTMGLKGLDPKSWFDRVTGSVDVRDGARLPSLYVEAVTLVRSGPQVFNQTWYQGAWGLPPQPWSAYYPGWQTPKPRKK